MVNSIEIQGDVERKVKAPSTKEPTSSDRLNIPYKRGPNHSLTYCNLTYSPCRRAASREQFGVAQQRLDQLVGDLSHGCGDRTTGKRLRPSWSLCCPAQTIRSYESFVSCV